MIVTRVVVFDGFPEEGLRSPSLSGCGPNRPTGLSVSRGPNCCINIRRVRGPKRLSGIIAATPAILLTTSYQATPSAFVGTVDFYANAKLSAVTFAGNFVLTIPFSDDPKLATADNFARFSVVVATVTAAAVPAPDYTLDVNGLLVLTDIDDVVQSVSGTAGLTAGGVAGQQ